MIHRSVIQVQDLVKLYGNVAAVSNISFEVMHGEVFGFLGPNGAGKTTTIRMLLDLQRPSSGSISMFGHDLSVSSFPVRKRCGYLPGNFSAYGNLTGHEFLHLCADLRNVRREIEPALLGRFGLDLRYLGRKIKHLSHGTIQKLGILQAFFHHPELLILDEPTIGLDPLMQEAFYDLIRERCAEGATIFISSHNLSEVERICHRLAIIRKGVIEKTGSLDSFRSQLKKSLRFKLSTPVEKVVLEGALLVKSEGLNYEFVIEGNVRAVLKNLAELPVESVVLPEPRLDEIFINFYKDADDD